MKLKVFKNTMIFLKNNPEKRFSAREIAHWMLTTYPDECLEKQKNAKNNRLDTDEKLLRQIAAEINRDRERMQKKYPEIQTIENSPREYYYTKSPESSNNSTIPESALYKVLYDFLQSEFKVYSKRIDEKRSSNNGGKGSNKWLHPDMVGIENLSRNWHPEIKCCAQQYSDKKTKLWSFEVKRQINRGNIREALFQTVSNSSWANLGYLASSEVENADTVRELQMLCNRHGIGFITLNIRNPSESQITIPAKERPHIDWNIANRLTEENKDFRDYITFIRRFYETGELRQSDFPPPKKTHKKR